MDKILKKKMAMIAAAVATGAVGVYFFFQPGKELVETEDIFAVSANDGIDEMTTETEAEPLIIKVDVKGAVQAPGIFTAEAGDRVIDLISKAGSFTDKADKDKVNFAQLVEDQMVIYVPKIGEEGIELPENASADSSGTAATGGASESSRGQVNLNTATKEDLETLSGIGTSKATAILEYRDTIGKFKQIDELKNVSGIGDKTFEKLKDSISVK
ncbi:helix-hairpin-helix domain-containing protein [Peribacillus butanolivorans]|uniref:helix-hairpin-helix domain-containing protein n=1 Tax=Peribacillus butanolivorans TaxID=421767 RepID=UPI00207C2F92|nr:helix-hairpin-helix domain-containing protein [Peribacillus butanolivorans]MCO0599863.1 helix-hairpin-helix domain-containing protein [Peribacillus butanolivorans]